MQGRIIKALAGFYYVEHDGVIYQTRARGNFRKKGQTPYVGDFVEFSAEENSEGYILKIGQRINSLVRPPIVNIDQAVVIMSVKEPDFNCNLLDRFLVLLEHKNIKPVIYISKMDLVEDDSEMKAIQKQYQRIGFDFIFSLEELLPLLTDKITVFMGQTGVGKSTLLNKLTDAGILAEDKLFATLDPTTRGLELESGQQILLTDTVGFIRKLPHHLIEAFKSTLEEARYSDMILHVVDCSNPNMDMQMHVVYETLRELKVGDKIIVTVFNKIDQKEDSEFPRDLQSDYQVQISAKTGAGLDELLSTLEQILRSQKVYLERVFSYQEAGKIQTIRKYGELLSEEYQADGIAVKAYVPAELFGSLITG